MAAIHPSHTTAPAPLPETLPVHRVACLPFLRHLVEEKPDRRRSPGIAGSLVKLGIGSREDSTWVTYQPADFLRAELLLRQNDSHKHVSDGVPRSGGSSRPRRAPPVTAPLSGQLHFITVAQFREYAEQKTIISGVVHATRDAGTDSVLYALAVRLSGTVGEHLLMEHQNRWPRRWTSFDRLIAFLDCEDVKLRSMVVKFDQLQEASR